MRRLVVGFAGAFIAGLAFYEAIALAVSFTALGVALYLLIRQERWEQQQEAKAQVVEAKAKALGDEIRDDLNGG